jgi:hypothetical protein
VAPQTEQSEPLVMAVPVKRCVKFATGLAQIARESYSPQEQFAVVQGGARSESVTPPLRPAYIADTVSGGTVPYESIAVVNI